jgi:hypothetical protein
MTGLSAVAGDRAPGWDKKEQRAEPPPAPVHLPPGQGSAIGRNVLATGV